MEFILLCIIPATLAIGLAVAIATAIGRASKSDKHLIRPHVLNRLVEQKLCEYCNTVNVASAYTCIKCKREFGSMNMTHPTIENMNLNRELRASVNDGQVQVCRNCGRLNSPTRTTCKTCQGDLSA